MSKLLLLAYLKLFLISAVIAQADDTSSEPIILPEIIVEGESEVTDYEVEDSSTATKFKVPIKDTPLSIQVIDKAVIDDQRAEQLTDTVYNVSGVQPAGGLVTPFLIRGFRAEVLRNGLTLSSIFPLNQLTEVITNIDRIEFIKGPNSVLSGTTSSGGLVNLVTKQPLPYFYSSGDFTMGSFNFFRGVLDYNRPLKKDKTLLFRVNASYRNSDSFREFIHSERFFVSPVLTWEISPKVKLTLDAEYIYIDEPIDDGIIAVGDEVANIPFSRNLGEPTDNTYYKNLLLEGILESEIRNNLKLVNVIRYFYVDAETDHHIPVFLQPDNQTLDRLIFKSPLYHDDFINTKNDLLVNINKFGTQNDIVIGFEYKKESLDNNVQFIPSTSIDIFDPVYNQQEPFNPNDFPVFVRNADTDEFGIYIQDFINYKDKLFILAGLRVDYYNYELADNVSSPDPAILIRADTDGFEFIPRFGMLYQLNEIISFYGNYSESLSTGLLLRSFQIEGGVLKPETAWQVEGGVKISLLDDKLFSTIAVYNIVKRNAFTADPINGLAFAVQVDKERSRGLEVDVTGELFSGLNLIASYSYIDAEVVEDDFFQSGNELAAVPKNSGSIWATYKLYSGPLEGLGIGAGMIAVGEREGDLENTFKLDGFIRLDTAIYYEKVLNDSMLINMSLNFKNITDKQYIATSDSRLSVIPGIPFSMFGNIRLEFF